MCGHNPDAPATQVTLDHDRPCLACGYNLRGLSTSGACPECGTPVERSLRGNLLVYSSPEYVASLHRGVFLIQAGIITQIVLWCALVGLFFASQAGLTGVGEQALELLGSLLGLAATIASVIGWWLLSAPDPAVLGTGTGDTPRRIVRITVIVSAAATAVQFALSVTNLALGPLSPHTGNPLELVELAANWAPIIAYIVWFFAAMHYILWLAPRLPSIKAITSARTLEWVGPVISVFLCVLGWLIALVMYYNLLDEVRLNLRRIRREQAKAAAA